MLFHIMGKIVKYHHQNRAYPIPYRLVLPPWYIQSTGNATRSTNLNPTGN